MAKKIIRLTGFAAITIIFLLSLTGCSTKMNLLRQGGFSEPQAQESGFRAAMARFVSLVRPHRGNPDSHYLLASYYQERGEHGKAMSEFEKVVLIKPDHVDAYNRMGISYDRLKDYPRAVESYKKALQINPRLHYVLNNLGYSYLLQGRADEALVSFRQALALNPAETRIHSNLGLAYAAKGDFDAALAEFKLANDEAQAHLNIAQLYFKEGRYRTARFHYGEVLRLAKSDHVRRAAEGGEALSRIFDNSEEDRKERRGEVIVPVVRDDGKEPAAAKISVVKEKSTASFIEEDLLPEKTTIGSRNDALDKSHASSPLITSAPDSMETVSFGSSMTAIKKMPPAEGVSLEISNGNGVKGIARRISRYLEEKGLVVSHITDADHFNHSRTIIYYANGYQAAALQVSDHIPGILKVQLGNKSGWPRRNVLVIIGKDLIEKDVIAADRQLVRAVTGPSPQPAGSEAFTAKDVSLEVSNGNGINGMAKKISEYLRQKGLAVIRVTNAEHFNHRQTAIYYKKGYRGAATQVGEQIPGFQFRNMKEQETLKPSQINVKVVIGRDILSEVALFAGGKQ